jgi:hypothetical protein
MSSCSVAAAVGNGDGHASSTLTTPAGSIGDHQKRRPDMTTEGIEAVFLETHNWGKAARFFQALGFDLEFSTVRGHPLRDHGNDRP